MLIKLASGAIQPSPWLAIATKQMELVHKLAAELGLSPVARTRVAARPSSRPSAFTGLLGGRDWREDAADEFFRSSGAHDGCQALAAGRRAEAPLAPTHDRYRGSSPQRNLFKAPPLLSGCGSHADIPAVWSRQPQETAMFRKLVVAVMVITSLSAAPALACVGNTCVCTKIGGTRVCI